VGRLMIVFVSLKSLVLVPEHISIQLGKFSVRYFVYACYGLS